MKEYCEATGFERKHANKVLRGQRRREGGSRRRGALARYSGKDMEVLKGVWLAAGQPCGKRFAGAMLELWLGSWERRHGALEAGQRERLGGISAAQLDRKLAPYRTGGKRRRVAAGGLAAMQREVAVRCEPWAETEPGAMEIDTVALCGGSLSGAIVWALDATDIHSGWTEVRAVWNRGGHATRERMSEIEEALPFALRKLDFDNGTEFLNAHFIAHFREREPQVELSRSRPYRKNDNAHIEQKNYTHVRLLLGDDRFEHYELVEPLNEVLKLWSVWNNLYGAQRRLVRKERRADGKIKRHHEKRAATPCARLLARKDLSGAQRRRLERLLEKHDPLECRERLEAALKALYEMRAKLQPDEEEQEQEQEQELNGETGRAKTVGPVRKAEGRPAPVSSSDRKAGLPSGRRVACGSRDSLRTGPPSGPKKPLCADLQRRKPGPKKKTSTVSSTVRHRAAS